MRIETLIIVASEVFSSRAKADRGTHLPSRWFFGLSTKKARAQRSKPAARSWPDVGAAFTAGTHSCVVITIRCRVPWKGNCYFTAPTIPLVKLFCRKKKMIAVGSVQIRTPSISMP
jgi:hypothetical protein